MKHPLKNTKGQVVGSIQVRDDVFGVPMNGPLVHQVMVGHLANRRQGTASTKTRAQVSGGGAKPRMQKHTGLARAGSTRAPNWRGGGVVFGPRPRSYRQRTPRRMRQLALVATLSDKVRDGQLEVLETLALDKPKTKEVVRVLEALDAGPSVLLVADGADPSVLRSARNIPRLKMMPASSLNTVDLFKYRKLIMTVEAVRKAEETWGDVRHRKKNAAPVGAEAQ